MTAAFFFVLPLFLCGRSLGIFPEVYTNLLPKNGITLPFGAFQAQERGMD